jgi:hypothetical protein
MSRGLVPFVLLFVIGIGVIAWSEYYPSSPMVTTLGLPGPRADVGRGCGLWYRQAWFGRFPLRKAVCQRPRMLGQDFWQREEVAFDALSRRIEHAQRMWSVADSLSWERARDSVGSAMSHLGGREFACWKTPYVFVTPVRDSRYWKFPTYSVRLTSYRFEDNSARSPWLLQLDGYPKLPLECVNDPWRDNR